MLHSLLYEQFAGRDLDPDYEFHHVDLLRTREFVEEEAAALQALI